MVSDMKYDGLACDCLQRMEVKTMSQVYKGKCNLVLLSLSVVVSGCQISGPLCVGVSAPSPLPKIGQIAIKKL